jgi:hypothetical protein
MVLCRVVDPDCQDTNYYMFLSFTRKRLGRYWSSEYTGAGPGREAVGGCYGPGQVR